MSFKIGVIFCGYNTVDLLPISLTPWIEARREHLGGNEFLICGVSCAFEKFDHGGSVDNTTALLEEHRLHNDIDGLITSNCPVKETEARGDALRWLVDKGCNISVIVDSDELWTEKQIVDALTFVEANPWVRWFRVAYKQMVFTDRQYLAEAFTPPRIHRVYGNGSYAAGFWDDNNVYYLSTKDKQASPQRDIECSSLTIPQEKVWVNHATWLSDLRSKNKQKYQRIRWGHSSFQWDDKTDQLRFDESYFAAAGLPLPEVITLED